MKPVGWVIWGVLALLVMGPVLIALNSPYLPGRNLAYVVAGLAGIAGLALLLVQPLVVAGYLPGIGASRGRVLHRWLGAGLVVAVALHVGGLYLTSAPDTLDALLLVSPTPFSVYGVTAMWAVVLTAVLVGLRARLGWRPEMWRVVHNGLAVVVVVGTVVHALLIDGTMGPVSKPVLCGAVLLATLVVMVHLRIVRPMRARS